MTNQIGVIDTEWKSSKYLGTNSKNDRYKQISADKAHLRHKMHCLWLSTKQLACLKKRRESGW